MSEEKLKALRQAADTFEFRHNKEPKCPHCGADFDIFGNEAYSLYDENDRHEVECPKCELPFQVESSCSWRFNTDEQEGFPI
jgi:uncharacterized Zn-finger protein